MPQILSVIYINPIGEIDESVLPGLIAGVARVFGIETATGRHLPVPEDSFDSARRQYRAGGFLDILSEERHTLPAGERKSMALLGVTGRDLFVPKLNYVFGVADHRRGVAVISLKRLALEYYGHPADEELFQERALKEAVHELGHVFGLAHCDDPRCIMHFSNTIGDTDRKGPGFCGRCAALLGLQLKKSPS